MNLKIFLSSIGKWLQGNYSYNTFHFKPISISHFSYQTSLTTKSKAICGLLREIQLFNTDILFFLNLDIALVFYQYLRALIVQC